jgi:hypothetical protein
LLLFEYNTPKTQKEDGSNTRIAQAKRAELTKVLKMLKGYSGNNRVFSIFKILIEEGNSE